MYPERVCSPRATARRTTSCCCPTPMAVVVMVINEGFALRSRHDAPVLRTIASSAGLHDEFDVSALRLAHILKRVRPELDLYLMSNRDVEEIAGNPDADVVRRIFYSVEELLELHLSILEGVQDRFDTPFFDNLKKYAHDRSARSMRCRSRAANPSSSPTGSATWASSTASTCSWPRAARPPAASTACWSRPATSRRHRTRPRAPSAPTASSSSPTAPRPRTRWPCRRCWRRATS